MLSPLLVSQILTLAARSDELHVIEDSAPLSQIDEAMAKLDFKTSRGPVVSKIALDQILPRMPIPRTNFAVVTNAR